MLTAIYRKGGAVNVWGIMSEVKQVDSEHLEQYLSDGWLDDPLKLLAEPKKKPGPKPKVSSDEDSDEG